MNNDCHTDSLEIELKTNTQEHDFKNLWTVAISLSLGAVVKPGANLEEGSWQLLSLKYIRPPGKKLISP